MKLIVLIMGKYLRFILESFFISVLLSVVNRSVFIIYYKDLISDSTFPELTQFLFTDYSSTAPSQPISLHCLF